MAAIVLLSGGLDSAVNLKCAVDDVGVALALTFDYGQRAAPREMAAAAAMARFLGVPHRPLALPWLGEITASPLVNPSQGVPVVTAAQLDHPRAAEASAALWVPNRNGLFVNIAAAFAEAMRAELVVAGLNAEEAAAFPDNSSEFIAAANRALALSTRSGVRLKSYTQDLHKADIVRLGRRVGAPLPLLWSCYGPGPRHCWRCESCARLERALRQADAWEWFRQGAHTEGR